MVGAGVFLSSETGKGIHARGALLTVDIPGNMRGNLEGGKSLLKDIKNL